MSLEPGRGGVLNAGGRAYDWVRKALGFYGTAVTLAQLIPALLALLAVTLSPTAWLSLTLRRWVFAGVIVGSVVGAAAFAVATRRWLRAGRATEARTGEARTADTRTADTRTDETRMADARTTDARTTDTRTTDARTTDDPSGEIAARTVAPPSRLRTMAYWGLGAAGVALAILRVHFAVVDVGVIERWPVLTPVFDFYLGGEGWQATTYNVVAASLSAAALVGIVLGAPAGAMLARDRRRARAELAAKGGPLHAIAEAEKALAGAKSALGVARSTITSLTEERDSLRAELALLQGDEWKRTEGARGEERRSEEGRSEERRSEERRSEERRIDGATRTQAAQPETNRPDAPATRSRRSARDHS